MLTAVWLAAMGPLVAEAKCGTTVLPIPCANVEKDFNVYQACTSSISSKQQ